MDIGEIERVWESEPVEEPATTDPVEEPTSPEPAEEPAESERVGDGRAALAVD